MSGRGLPDAAYGPHTDAADGVDVRLNDDGTIDEVVTAAAHVHLEQMDDGAFWIGIGLPNGETQHVWLQATKGGKLYATVYQ